MSETEGMLTKLMNQLVAQGEQLQSMSTKLIPSDLSVVGCENDASIQKSNVLATSEKEMETRETVNFVGSKKTTKSLGKESSCQHSQSQENVSPLLVLPPVHQDPLTHTPQHRSKYPCGSMNVSNIILRPTSLPLALCKVRLSLASCKVRLFSKNSA
ncbi:hypothetical protein Tco_0567553 [Tanacetum coccineum]